MNKRQQLYGEYSSLAKQIREFIYIFGGELIRFCECGCNKRTAAPWHRFLFKHRKKQRTYCFCACGCGGKVYRGKYVKGHYTWPEERRIEQSKRKKLLYLNPKGRKVKDKISFSLVDYYKDNPKEGIPVGEETKRKISRSIYRKWRSKDYRMKMTGGDKNYEHGYLITKKGGKLYYRSSWERLFIEMMESSKLVKSFVYEPFGIKYKFEGKSHNYYPDFLIKTKDNQMFIIEIKAQLNEREEVKINSAKEFCENKGYEFVVIGEKPLQPITRYLQ